MSTTTLATRYRAVTAHALDDLARRYALDDDTVRAVRLLSHVLPFRVNTHVLEELIDWSDVPGDPMYQLTFPQPGMLPAEDMHALAAAEHDRGALREVVRAIHARLNPHPSGQQEHNVPVLDDEPLPGLQHKYAETVLLFPSQGQTCHAYCSYCFRWAQFVGDPGQRFATSRPDDAVSYLRRHPEVEDVVITGGDPMMMSADRLREHVRALLTVPTLRTIRIGTKALTFWPMRFLTDRDSDDLLRVLESVVDSGRRLAVMAHLSHPRELRPQATLTAVRRLRSVGAQLYAQAPLVAHVNDDAAVWSRLWREESMEGITPYYMFVERDTGPYDYFKVPLVSAWQTFRDAYSSLPGLARTVRGPVMSATPGKIVVDGASVVDGQAVLDLRFIQARDPALTGRPFTATGAPSASWAADLTAAPGTPVDLASALLTARRNA
ncbi:4Fe-4S cluster-binding domain-containing protein [Streptomyces sp. NPDC046985]|uniref:KamA family radical SAM protein n=1 Tax=Streptomyces sp. NPDC046985 TaxID=3155377 RepID=UPI0033D79B68